MFRRLKFGGHYVASHEPSDLTEAAGGISINFVYRALSLLAKAESLVLELIRGGYFPNDKIEETKISEVQKVIDKYIFILKNSPENTKGRAGLQFYNRILEIAACEIEETLDPSLKEMALIDYMFEHMKERISINENVYERGLLKKEDKDIQIYIAVQQALFKLDAPMISYNLIRYKYPQWENPSDEELLKIEIKMTSNQKKET